MERKLKNLAAFLIVTFMTTMIPTSVMAAEEPSFTGSEQSNIKKASIVGELKEKREENVKYFLMDDGTYQAVVYNEPVHYMADGKWEDIDNTLVETTGYENIDDTGGQSDELIEETEGAANLGSEEVTQGTEGATDPSSEEVIQGTEGTAAPGSEEVVGSEEGGGYYQNTKNEINVKIAKNINDKKLVSIKKDNYEVSWNMKVSGQSKGEVKEKNIDNEIETFYADDTSDSVETKKENMKKTVASHNNSQVDFTDIGDGVDLQYLLQGKTLKENIVINKAISENSFTFNLSLKNLIPEVKDNTVKFLDKDTKKDVFYIVPPLMYDAAGETSTNIKIDIKSDKNGYILTLSPDKEWINNSSRKFPIVLDPDITTSLVQSDIVETFICSNDPSSKADNMFVRVGDVTSIGTTETYIRFNNLPALKTGDMVTSSQLYLYKESAYSGADGEIEAHRILSDWSTSTINWSNKPSVESSITDTQKVSQDWYSWDITNMTKDWYNNGNNYGLKLNRTDPASGNTTFLSSDTSSEYSGGWPQVVVSYINNSGLEGYWTYHSQSAGRAGTGYVNDYNGNLIFTHDDIDSSGSRMPISVKHVYNSNDRESSFGYGLGWRTNLNQRVLSQVIDGTQYYVYIDEDGTKHYFYYDSTSSSYKNEEGLELTLKVNSDSSYDIIDKSGTDLYFVPGGYLHKIIDKNNNTAYVWYNGATLSRVVDGAGRTTLFESTPEGYLLSITDPAGRKTEYRYNGIELSTIIYPDGNRTIYYYDANHNMTDAINYDGMRLDFDYYTASPYRTQKVKLIGSDGASGGELNFDYGFNETSFTDVKGRKETYQFNNSGNTICVTDPNGNAEAYKYLSNSNGKSNNKLDVESKLQKNSRNYLKNHSAETADSNWDFGYWGASPLGSGSFSSEASFIGSKSLKVSKTDYFDRNFYSQTLNLTKGKTYTLSGYIKTIDVTSDKNKGAGLFVNYQDSSGNWQTVDGNYVTGTNDWERYSVTFTLPSDASSTTVFARAGISEDKGTAYFDALQLEEGNIENRYNLLENSDFDYGSPTSEKWTYNTCDSKGIVTTLENRSAFRFDGDLGKSKNISQEVNVSGNAGDSFVISGWAKADALPENTGTYRYFALDLGFHLADGTYQWEVVKFNSDTGNWQFTSGRAVAKQNYTSVTMYALYYDEENYAWFDNLQLYKEEFGQSYQYDSKGNVVSTADLAKQQSSFEYNGNNDLVTATDPKGGKFSYTYYDNRNIKTATSAENVVYSFEYDAYGNPKKTTIGGAPFISSSATYTADGNYTSTVTDASGNTVSYDYDLNKGTLKTSTDAKGKVTTNGYDSNDRLTSVTKNVDGADITNSYAYVNDRLDTITHNGFNYKFKYDSIGRNTGVDVGTQNLITNTYEPNGGNLLESTYGNGDKVGNDFDSLDRVISKKVNGTEIAHYTYDSNGGLGILEDKVNNVTYKYTYDLADRLTKVTDSKGNIFKNSYDTNNNISKQTRIIGGNAFETGYEFDKDNKIKKVTLNSTAKYVGYNYDSLARLQDRTINFGNSGTYITSFSYLPGANGSATTKVGSINNNGSILNYTYDSNGNIETISQGTNRIQKYYYNELSELIREDNKVLNKTIKYTYDAGGNIVSKTEYAYTEAADPGTPTSTINYQYGDSNWKDKLTSYNGKAISYDEIGNPLTYDGYTYSWDRGRTLTGITGNEKNISYKYNDSGIRTEKNVNGTVSKYILNGDKVAYEEVTDGINTDKLHYNYDSNGDVVSLSYNDYRNIVGGSSAIGSFETPDSIGGVSLIDVTIPQTSTNKRAIRLNAGASIPAIASPALNLKVNTTYVVEFDYWSDADNQKFDVDLFPDDLPQKYPTANKSLQHFRWELRSQSSNMLNSKLRFFNDLSQTNSSNIYITNIKLYEIPNIVGSSSAIGSFETPDSIGGVSLVDVTIPQTSTNKRAIRLNAGASIPAIASPALNLKVNTTYVVEFDYWSDADNQKFDVDLFPDDLPQKYPTANKSLQHFRWELSSQSSNMQNSKLRFFNDLSQTNQSNIYITNIELYELDAQKNDGGEYYYVRNLQGDIIGLIDSTGTQVVSYTYDSWGKLISIDGSLKDTLGVKNPYRYRGYRYDTETGLYYLQSRYYNPETCRMLNADSLGGETGKLLSHNVFAYCSNNPVTRFDPDGRLWWVALIPIATAVIAWATAVMSSPDINTDIAAICSDIDGGNKLALGVDIACAAIPALPAAGGKVVSTANLASKSIKGGKFANIDAVKGVDEVGHHMAQNAFNKTIGISRADGPALLMSKSDHALTRTFAGKGRATMRNDAGLTARQRIFLDVMDIRSQFGSKYNQGMIQMLDYANTLPQYTK